MGTEMFQNGEAVCFLGDSITHAKSFHGMILAYYLTRFPDRTIHFINAGVAGDNAGAAMVRLEEDVIVKQPSTVVVMMGMNDVGRGNYVADPTDARLAAQEHSLNAYRTNMERLLERLARELSPKFILLTPTPFDQTCVNDRNNNQPGCNEGLGKCGDIVRELAPRFNALIVDLHGPMTAFNLEKQKADPHYTLIGPDRVHPGLPGDFMMAWLFLKAQGVPALVSTVAFDAGTGQVTDAANATLSEIGRTDSGWTFTVQEKALPYPVDTRLDEMLHELPVEQDLNQENLRITGLPEGNHILLIDGTEVACHTAGEWNQGINLAFNSATPQYRQAQHVLQINEKRRQTEVKLRDYACSRWFLRLRKIDPDNLEAVKEYAETKMAKTGYYEQRIPIYLAEWAGRAGVEAEVNRLEQEALQARIPGSHRYEIQLQR